MKLIHDPDLISKLRDCHLILDANVFLHAVDNAEFRELLAQIKDGGCALITIPSVVFEFARGAKDIEQFNWYVDFVNSLGVVAYKNVETEIMGDKAFAVLLQKYSSSGKKGISYTDFLLLMLLHKFRHTSDKIFFMTSNYTDVPLEVFDRSDIISLEYKGGVQSQALYKNSADKLKKLASSL